MRRPQAAERFALPPLSLLPLPFGAPRLLAPAQIGILDEQPDAHQVELVRRLRRRRPGDLDDGLDVSASAFAARVLALHVGQPAFARPEIANDVVITGDFLVDAQARRAIRR